jgi:hypothetical protein
MGLKTNRTSFLRGNRMYVPGTSQHGTKNVKTCNLTTRTPLRQVKTMTNSGTP